MKKTKNNSITASYRIGEQLIQNDGYIAEVIDYNNSKDITVQFENGKKRRHCAYQDFCMGRLTQKGWKRGQFYRPERIKIRKAIFDIEEE